jgi:hypothetical protein
VVCITNIGWRRQQHERWAKITAKGLFAEDTLTSGVTPGRPSRFRLEIQTGKGGILADAS